MFSMTAPALIDGLVQEERNSIAIALELRLPCINLSKCWAKYELMYQRNSSSYSTAGVMYELVCCNNTKSRCLISLHKEEINIEVRCHNIDVFGKDVTKNTLRGRNSYINCCSYKNDHDSLCLPDKYI